MSRWAQIKKWLLPAALILFLLEAVLFPFAISMTYAGRSDSPDHTLTYTLGCLTWDSATDIGPDGVAELSLFSASYQNVLSNNGDKVVAPGTEGRNIVRLKNDSSNRIQYVAVFYRIKEEPALPVEPEMEGEGFADTTSYPLPDGVTKDQVVRAVTGMLFPEEIQDFDISWQWNYYDSDQRDQVDTALGDKAAFAEADEVTAGLYIVVVEEPEGPPPYLPEDPGEPLEPDNGPPSPPGPLVPGGPGSSRGVPGTGESGGAAAPQAPGSEGTDALDVPDTGAASYIYPQVPQTGDTTHLTLYLVLMAVSGVLLLLLLLDHRKENKGD